MAYPDAALYELSPNGIEPIAFADLTAVNLWSRFFDDPANYYRPLLADD